MCTFANNGQHYGLIGMRERAEKLGGEFNVTSSPGNGTKVCFSIPLTKSAIHENR